MKNPHLKHIAEINVAMLFISTSGVLGRYISMPPVITIWWRALFAVLIVGVFCWYKKINFKVVNQKDWRTLLLSGVLFGGHWVTYFYSLQISNVAIGLLSLFTYPVITALLEPLFFNSKLNLKHIFFGILILIGIYFLIPEFNLENNHTKGILWGLLSAVFYALRNILLKTKISNYNALTLMFYQLLTVVIILSPSFFLVQAVPTTNEWGALIFLALVTTAIGHTLFVSSFKHFSIGSVSILSSIQPIYGILLGILFLSEIPSINTLIGGTIILATVVIESVQSKKK